MHFVLHIFFILFSLFFLRQVSVRKPVPAGRRPCSLMPRKISGIEPKIVLITLKYSPFADVPRASVQALSTRRETGRTRQRKGREDDQAVGRRHDKAAPSRRFLQDLLRLLPNMH